MHEAVLAAGDTESGITIHYVNEQYDDGGGHHLQERCAPFRRTIRPKPFAKKVQALEHHWFPLIVERIIVIVVPAVKGKTVRLLASTLPLYEKNITLFFLFVSAGLTAAAQQNDAPFIKGTYL